MSDEHKTPEQAALDAWNSVPPDTTGMLFAVRAALRAAERPVDKVVADLEAEIAWRKEAKNPDLAEIGRVVGLEDALSIVRRVAGR